MVDRPILFSTPMVRALLDGRKTQTRRIFKGAEQNEIGLWHVYGSGGGVIGVAEEDVGKQAVDYLPIQVGDRLWVRETWSGHQVFREIPPAQRVSFSTPDGPYLREDVWFWADGRPDGGDYEKPRPGIHMPRWASRLTLPVTEVRVERLQDCSEADAIAEGVPSNDDYAGSFAEEFCHHCGGSGLHGAFGEGYGVTEVDCAQCETPQLRYRNLWNTINGPGAWEANPWVAAYTFTVERKNIDEVRDAT